MKIGILTAAVVLLAATGGYIYTKQASTRITIPTREAPGMGVLGLAASSTDLFDIEITYDGTAYTPEEITIKKGQRVRFINVSSEETWPASGIHPTHSLYPEKRESDCLGSSFDSCRPLVKGEFYAFTFNYMGEWRYHDHQHPFHTGVIKVQP